MNIRKTLFVIVVVCGMLSPLALYAQATGNTPKTAVSGNTVPGTNSQIGLPYVDFNVRPAKNNGEVVLSLQLLLLLSVLTLAPSLLILMTSFIRIALIFEFVKRALSLQQVPPNQILMGIALFLTIFIMWPTFDKIYNDSIKPFSDGKIGFQEMYKKAEAPIRLFMYKQMNDDPSNIRLFMKMRGLNKPKTLADVPTYVLIPAFVLHEMTVAFKIGILLFIPFIIIDMVVASTLMSMGMIMLPPVMISLPFKLILFVLVDGWSLITLEIVKSFR